MEQKPVHGRDRQTVCRGWGSAADLAMREAGRQSCPK